jgi:hypothetical protein
MTPAAHAIEDRLRAIANPSDPSASGRPAARDAARRRTLEQLGAIETELATLDVPYDDWETLQRIAMQIERSAR